MCLYVDVMYLPQKELSMKKTSECQVEPRLMTKAQRLEGLRWPSGTPFNAVERFHSYKKEWCKVFNSPGLVGTSDEHLASWVLKATPDYLHHLISTAIEDGYPADSAVCNSLCYCFIDVI